MIMWHVTLLPPDAILGSKCTQNVFAEGEGWEGREMDPRNFDNRLTPMLKITWTKKQRAQPINSNPDIVSK